MGFATFRLFDFIPRDKLHSSGQGPWDEFIQPSECNSSVGMKSSLQVAKPNSSFQPCKKLYNSHKIISLNQLVIIRFHTVWKKEKISLTEKKTREINSLVKLLLSRIFCQKSVRENFRNFHTAWRDLRHVEKYYNSAIMLINFPWSQLYINFFAKNVIFPQRNVFVFIPHSQCWKTRNSLPAT